MSVIFKNINNLQGEASKFFIKCKSPITKGLARRLRKNDNKKEIRFFSMKRSGSHAVIDWIKRQQYGRISYSNNVRPGSDPFKRFQIEYLNNNRKKFLKFVNEDELDRYSKQDCILHTYEEYPLPLSMRELKEHTADNLGYFKDRFDVLLIRNPMNIMASRIKWKPYFTSRPFYRSYVRDLWKEYAREYLDKTRTLTNNVVKIAFDRWFKDDKYRAQKAKELGLIHTDEGLNKVAVYGRGSSFDHHNYRNKANKMGVLERWKACREHDDFKDFMNDEELWDLMEEIFSDLPSRKEFVTSA